MYMAKRHNQINNCLFVQKVRKQQKKYYAASSLESDPSVCIIMFIYFDESHTRTLITDSNCNG